MKLVTLGRYAFWFDLHHVNHLNRIFFVGVVMDRHFLPQSVQNFQRGVQKQNLVVCFIVHLVGQVQVKNLAVSSAPFEYTFSPVSALVFLGEIVPLVNLTRKL